MVEELFIKNTQKSVFRSSSNYTLEWRNNPIWRREPQFHITFHKPLSKRIAKDPSIAFGEAYMNGDLEIEGNLEKQFNLFIKGRIAF